MQRVIIFAPNWVGDAVMAQPAIADVRRAIPAATLAVAAKRSVAPVFQMTPGVDETIVLEDAAASVRRHAPQGFDVALLLPNSLHAAIVAFGARIPERWGYRTDCRSPLLTRAVPRERGLHQVDSFRRLVRALGFPNGAAEPSLRVSDELRTMGAAQLKSAGWDGVSPLVALAPGAVYGSSKQWPARFFAELADGLAADGVRPVLVGGADDVPIGLEIVREMTHQRAAIDLVGKNDVAGMSGVFTHARALVSNDSGAMHLGAAVGIPVTAVFGPTDERLTRPMGERHTVLTHDVWCRPCMLRECPIDHRCMEQISPSAVAEATRRWL